MGDNVILAAAGTFVLSIVIAILVWMASRSARSVKMSVADVATRFRVAAPLARGDTLRLRFTTNGKPRSFVITVPEDLSESASNAVVADAAQTLYRYVVSHQQVSERSMRLAEHALPIREIALPIRETSRRSSARQRSDNPVWAASNSVAYVLVVYLLWTRK